MNRPSENVSVEYYESLRDNLRDELAMLPAGLHKEMALALIEAGMQQAITAAAQPQYPEQAIGGTG